MKNFEGPRKKKKFLLPVLILLLAVLCVGGVELLVCSYQDPALYARITAPVRAGVQRAAEAGQQAWEGLGRAADELGRGAAAAADRVSAAANRAGERIRELLTPPAPEPEPEEELQLVDGDAQLAPPPRPPAVYTVTALESRDGREYLTGGAREFVYYNQTDEAWAEEKYGSDRLGGYGCGPTAMAMAVSSLTEFDMDPALMAQHCVDHGYWARRRGSYLSVVPGTAEDFGLTCTSLPPEETDADLIYQHLLSGSLIVALMGPGHFTNSGHFVVLRGVTLDGSVLVADPANRERSLTTWDPELILEELSGSRSSGGPLWLISSSPLE